MDDSDDLVTWRRWTALPAAVLGLAGCSGGGLAEDDPDGYQACLALREVLDDASAGRDIIEGLIEVGSRASESTTDAIRASARDLGPEGSPIVDVDQLTTACGDAGASVE